ncbi:MAG: NADH-quinone oxidoreductase subunit J [Chloroflexi bacterium]|nr:NADH-quinone oxidoreductase subunit J [Chloroflexota bacterium]
MGGLLVALVATPIVIVPLLFLVLDEISAAEFVFWLVAAVIILGALGAVLLPNIVHATLALVVTLLAVAGIYLLLSSEFLALVQVLIFGGGVTILLLFGLMMTKAQDDPIVSDGAQKPFAFGVGALLAGVLTVAVLDVEWADEAGATVVPFRELGVRLFRDFGIPFEVASLVLLVALIGAVAIARHSEPEPEELAEERTE